MMDTHVEPEVVPQLVGALREKVNTTLPEQFRELPNVLLDLILEVAKYTYAVLDPEHASRWNHAICERCWIGRNTSHDAEGMRIRRPVTLQMADASTCCFCGQLTIMGAYVRHNPDGLENCQYQDAT